MWFHPHCCLPPKLPSVGMALLPQSRSWNEEGPEIRAQITQSQHVMSVRNPGFVSH